MATVAPPPVVLLTRITAFIEAQNGGETVKELLPSLALHVSTPRAVPQTAESVSEIICVSQVHTKRMRERIHKREKAVGLHKELMEKAASTRLTVERRVNLLKAGAPTIRAFKTVKIVTKNARMMAEEKLTTAVAELRKRNNKAAADERQRVLDEKEETKQKKEEEKKVKEAQKAAEKAEKKLAEENKKAAELELRLRLTDERALQLMDAKAKKVNSEKQRLEDAAEQREATKLTKIALRMWIDQQPRQSVLSDEKDEETEENDDNKENIEPADE